MKVVAFLLTKMVVLTVASLLLNTTYAKEKKLPAMNKRVLSNKTFWSNTDCRYKIKHTMMASEVKLADRRAIALLTRYDVKKDAQQKFRKAIQEYVQGANAEESNIMAEGYYEEQDSSIVWIIERWTDQTSMEQFREGSAFKLISALSENNLAGAPKTIYITDLEPISKNEWRRPAAKNDEPITIMLFVDSKAGTEEIFKETYHDAMPKFRSEPGVINYQLSQLKDDSTQFVTYEKFRNEDAFQYHLKFPPIQPVIDYLNTSIKQQPFQTGLHRLIGCAPAKR